GSEEGDYTPSGGAAAARRLIAANAPFDAIFIASAQMASGALAVLKESGLDVPADVAIATMDNNVFSTGTTPQLTTVDLHTAEKGDRRAPDQGRADRHPDPGAHGSRRAGVHRARTCASG